MLFARNGVAPRIDRDAHVAPTASVVGDVTIGAGCYVDYGVVISSSGPRVVIADGVSVLANAVIRSVGDFFGWAFGVAQVDQEQLHRDAAARLRAEAAAWTDDPIPPPHDRTG